MKLFDRMFTIKPLDWQKVLENLVLAPQFPVRIVLIELTFSMNSYVKAVSVAYELG